MRYTIAGLERAIGTELFCSDWVTIRLGDELAFQKATFLTEDFLGRPLPNNTPYGERLLSGFLLLSLLVAFHEKYLPVDMEEGYALNYGADRVRFLRPIFAGQQIRCRALLTDLTSKQDGRFRCVTTNVLEASDAPEPVVTADWITYLVIGPTAQTR